MVPGSVQTVPGGSGQHPDSSGRLLVGPGMATVAGVASCTNKKKYIYIYISPYVYINVITANLRTVSQGINLTSCDLT